MEHTVMQFICAWLIIKYCLGLDPALLGAGEEGVHYVLQEDAGLLPARPEVKERGTTASHGAQWYTCTIIIMIILCGINCEFMAGFNSTVLFLFKLVPRPHSQLFNIARSCIERSESVGVLDSWMGNRHSSQLYSKEISGNNVSFSSSAAADRESEAAGLRSGGGYSWDNGGKKEDHPQPHHRVCQLLQW